MFSEADLKPAFRLSNDSIIVLIQMLLWQKPHGRSHESELSERLYGLTWGTSCRVTADIFAMPRATVGGTVVSFRGRDGGHPSHVLFDFPQARRDGGGGCRLCSSVWPWGILLCGWCNGSCSHMLKHCNTSSIPRSRGVCEHDWLASYACRRLWSFSTQKTLKHIFNSPSIFVKLTTFKTKLISN